MQVPRRTSLSGTAVVCLGALSFAAVAAVAQVTQPTLDGNLSDFKNVVDDVNADGLRAAAIAASDNLPNDGNYCIDGFGDEPLSNIIYPNDFPDAHRIHSPMNTGTVYVIYVPDSDGNVDPNDPGTDDSWLGIGFDIANGDGDIKELVGAGANLCRGGSNEGNTCIGSGDCPGGECVLCGPLTGKDRRKSWFEAPDVPMRCSAGGTRAGLPCTVDADCGGSTCTVPIIMVPFDGDGDGDPGSLGTLGNSRIFPFDFTSGFDEADEDYTSFFTLCPGGDERDYEVALQQDSEQNTRYEEKGLKLGVCALNPGAGTPCVLDPQDLGFCSAGGGFGCVPGLCVGGSNDGFPCRRLGDPTECPGGTCTEFAVQSFPPVGSSVQEIIDRGLDGVLFNGVGEDGLGNDDVELLIERIDSRIMRDLYPGEDYLTLVRFKAAEMAMSFRSGTTGDLSQEDTLDTQLRLDIPELEVQKQVRCVGNTDWKTSTEALSGSDVEFRIIVENTGNVALNVWLEDVLSPLGVDGVTVDLNSISATLTRRGTSFVLPADIADTRLCVSGSNISQPCGSDADCNNEFGACQASISAVPFLPGIAGFLGAVSQGAADSCDAKTLLGTLLGVDACAGEVGDIVEITFTATVPTDCTLDVRNGVTAKGVATQPALQCPANPNEPDAQDIKDDRDTTFENLLNVCSVTGNFCKDVSDCGPGETCDPLGPNEDNNSVVVDLLCRGFEFRKEVAMVGCSGGLNAGDPCVDNGDCDGGTCVTGFRCSGNNLATCATDDDCPSGQTCSGSNELFVPSIDVDNPQEVVIEYRYVATNTGEVSEILSIKDDELCTDLDQVASGVTLLSCDVCSQSGPSIIPASPAFSGTRGPGGSLTAACTVQFSTQAALNDFMGQDEDANDDVPFSCTGEPSVPPEDRQFCYRNCASGSALAASLEQEGICDGVGALELKDHTTVCNFSCNIDVVKQVRCVGRNASGVCDPSCRPDSPPGQCLPLGSDVDWSDTLEALPGACVQYRIVTTNISSFVRLGGISLADTLTGAGNFNNSAPQNVQVMGATCQPDIAGDFNWNGDKVVCSFQNSPLEQNESVTVLFQAELAQDALSNKTITNSVDVFGFAEGDPNPSCEDSDTAEIFVQSCDFEVTKDVTCDDPRATLPAPDFDPDNVEALPGSTVGFRILVCNTGKVPLSAVDINEQLTGCSTWYKPNSVVVDIDGQPATSCICPDNVGTANDRCPNFSDLSGHKDLSSCGGIPPNQCLTVTFEVTVPADFNTNGNRSDFDCENRVDVQGVSDVCGGNSPTNPCPSRFDTVTINVREPEINCAKEACLDRNNDNDCTDVALGDVPFANPLLADSEPTDYPLSVIYRYSVVNKGETDFGSSTICDPDLVAAAQAAGVTMVNCALDPVTGCANVGSLGNGDAGDPPGTRAVTCRLQFTDFKQWLDFAAQDGTDDTCHDNTASASGNVNTIGLCSRGADTRVDSGDCDLRVCISQCELDVVKRVRCLQDCSPSQAGPWVEDPAMLEVTPGSCVEYEIKVTNDSQADVPFYLLKFTDTLSGKSSFISGPDNVDLTGRTCVNGGTAAFESCFNWDGTPCCCELNAPLGQGDSVTLSFRGKLADNASAAISPENVVNVMGTTVPGSCGTSPASCGQCADEDFSCEDDSRVAIDVEECDFEVQKLVDCDEPDLTAALPDGVDKLNALAGDQAWFWFEIHNTGSVDINKVRIRDTLGSCTYADQCMAFMGSPGDWTDVTGCICGTGTLSQINRDHDLAGACGQALEPGDRLRVKFQVDVRSSDCLNTVVVNAVTDTCSAGNGFTDSGNPCGSREDDAEINVVVPNVECGKSVCIEQADGTCDPNFPLRSSLKVRDPVFPVNLKYCWKAQNTGDTGLANVEICDGTLVSQVNNPGNAVTFVGTCPLSPSGCATVSPDQQVCCTISIPDMNTWASFAGGAPTQQVCYNNRSTVTADPVATNICEPVPEVSDTCSATACMGGVVCERPPCPPTTKVKFDVWNEQEIKFEGPERCMDSWSQRLLSEYTKVGEFDDPIANNFWRTILNTDKGKARIDGIASDVVCGPDSIDAPLLGVASKILFFNCDPNNRQIARSGSALVGQGSEPGYILANPGIQNPDPPEAVGGGGSRFTGGDRSGRGDGIRAPFPLEPAAGGAAPDKVATPTEKGSLLVYPKIEIKWNAAGDVIQDTIVQITNDYPRPVRVQLYIVDGDLCRVSDNGITLTPNEPTYWSALTGMPKGVSPFTVLSDGCPDLEPGCNTGAGITPINPGGRVLRGYLLVWAIDQETRREIRWNHLTGKATIVNYADMTAWEYGGWAFRAFAGLRTADGLLEPYGRLELNGQEYSYPPDRLILDFFGSGTLLDSGTGRQVSIDTDLTLWAAIKNLTSEPDPGE